MRILQVNKFFFSKGGTERYFFLVSRELEKLGHEVVHFSMLHPDNAPSPFSRYFVEKKDFYESAALSEKIRMGTAFIRSGEAAKRIRLLVREHRPDVAHLHNIYHQLTPSIITVLRKERVPMVMTVHDYKLVCPNYSLYARGGFCFECRNGNYLHAVFARCNGGSLTRSLLVAAEAFYQRWTGVYGAVDLLIAPSGFMRGRLIEGGYSPSRVVFLPPFVDSPVGEPGDGAAGREGPDLPPKYILYFGRLSREKGLLLLLEAAERLPRVRIVVSGGGPLEAELRRRARAGRAKNVTITGHLGSGALGSVLKGAHAVVLPSLSPENAPFAVLEAAACGKAVIASDVGGIPEMVGKLGGFLFRAGSIDGLVSVMEKVWEDGESAEREGKRAREALGEHFDKETHMRRLLDLYRAVSESA